MKFLNSNPEYGYPLYVVMKDGTIIKIDVEDSFYYDESFISIVRKDGFLIMVPCGNIREIRNQIKHDKT